MLPFGQSADPIGQYKQMTEGYAKEMVPTTYGGEPFYLDHPMPIRRRSAHAPVQLLATQAILKRANQEFLHAHIRGCVREGLQTDAPSPRGFGVAGANDFLLKEQRQLASRF